MVKRGYRKLGFSPFVYMLLLMVGCCVSFLTFKCDGQTPKLKAKDINGFALGMTTDQVRSVAGGSLEALGGNQFKLQRDGIDYDFGFSVLGHLFRIDSQQILGNFIPDKTFAHSVGEKLSAKYGLSIHGQMEEGPFSWAFTEKYEGDYGVLLNRPTLELSAYWAGGDGSPIELHIHLIDFRIEREDLKVRNIAPRDDATGKVKF